jgi:hypothetical protein
MRDDFSIIYANQDFLKAMGIEASETNLRQLAILVRAYYKFVERNAKYKDLWAEYGIDDSLLHIKSKAARIVRLVAEDGLGADIDDAIDLINYTVFFIRLFEQAQVIADQEAEGT